MKPIELKSPKSLSLVYAVFPLLSKQPMVAYAAAIGVCWKGKPLDGDYYGPMNKYGHEVIDQLMSAGYKAEEIVESGVKAVLMLQELLPDAEEVDEIEGNSEAKDVK